MEKIFRFDDICINTDIQNAIKIATHINSIFENVNIVFAISPLVNNIISEDTTISQRVYPQIFNAYSDFRIFYNVDKGGIPLFSEEIIRASHGLIHIDHRLLTKEAQELSILSSCSLMKSSIFVPPFNI